jgi:para-nitrobenzyl esterase
MDWERSTAISRRDTLRLAVAGAAATGFLLSGVTGLEASDGPIVTTAEGRLKGVRTDKLNVFKGVHYGETTAGQGRFRSPVPVKSWEGVRDAVNLGDPCFQNNPDWEGWKENNNGSEDCLVLNIWSPRDARGKPVMVFLHGGAYMYGSGGAPMYDGAGLAERGDVVVVTLNHRIHMLGFMYLAAISDEYKGTANVGLQDIVEALRWVKRNIVAFGGSPDNVTIFGESGGGGKVSCLMAMPSAAGLFHKAIVQSGSQLKLRSAEHALADTRAALKLFGIAESDLAALPKVAPQAIWDAYMKVTEGNIRGGFSDYAFTPVLDPDTLPHESGSPEAIAISKDIPLLVGSNEAEGTFPLLIAGLLAPPADEAAIAPTLRQLFPKAGADGMAKLQKLVDAFKVRNPDADPLHLLVDASTELWMGRDAIWQAEARLSQGVSAGTFMYRFGWKEPCFGGEWATHAAELPFVFDRLGIERIWGDDGLEQAREKLDPDGKRFALRDGIIETWSSFARNGKPSSTKLAEWPAYSADSRSVMRFDKDTALLTDPLGLEIRTLLSGLDVGVGS